MKHPSHSIELVHLPENSRHTRDQLIVQWEAYDLPEWLSLVGQSFRILWNSIVHSGYAQVYCVDIPKLKEIINEIETKPTEES